MDFYSLSRKELQSLCKKNKIPANITNVAMADALAALPQVEGLDEFLNQREGGDFGTPDVHHRTAGRISTQRKTVKEPESSKVTPAVVPSSRRRVPPAVSTRRKKEVEIMLEEVGGDDGDKNGKPIELPKTPAVAAPSSRTRATGRSVCNKNETPSGACNTRRSVRLLQKSLSKMSLVDTEDMGLSKTDDVSEELSSSVTVSQQVEDYSLNTEKGASLQTVSSTVVSENTEELEVSSVNKAEDVECQSHDSGSEVKLVSGIENDVEDELQQAKPQEEEGSEKINLVEEAETHDSNSELQGSFETCEDSNEAGSELLPELEESGDSANVDEDECIGTKQDALSVEVSGEATVEIADKDIVALPAVVPENACMDAPVQVVADKDNVALSDVNDASVSLKELVEGNIDMQGNNACGADDDDQEKNNETEVLNMANGNHVQNFELVEDEVDEKAADKKDVTSSEGVLELDSSETVYASDVTVAASVILAEKDESSENAEAENEEKESVEVENVIVQLALLDVAAQKAEDQKDASEKLDAEAQAEKSEDPAAVENTDAGNAFSSVLDGSKTNTPVDGETDVISVDFVIPKEVSYMTEAEIYEQKTDDIVIQPVVSEKSETKEIAIEMQTVAKMTSVENGMLSATNNVMKENLKTADDFSKLSLRELRKKLRNVDGKANRVAHNNDVHMQEVEKKRTALQALPQNLMKTGEAQNDG